MGKPRIKKRSRSGERVVEVDEETAKALELQIEAFREKFGREPEPDDPLFFDPDADTPVPIDVEEVSAQIIKAMASAGLDPAKIYAFHRTGLMVTETNLHLLSAEDLDEWQAAIDEYNEKTKGKPS